MADEDRAGRVELRSSAGSTSSASSWKNAGVRGSGGGSERPWPKRENASTRRPVAACERGREVAPQADRPEPLVEEHDRPARGVARMLDGVDAAARDGGGAGDGGGRAHAARSVMPRGRAATDRPYDTPDSRAASAGARAASRSLARAAR